MKSRKASAAKVVALAVVPLGLASVLVNVGRQRRAEAATQRLYDSLLSSDATLDTPALKEVLAEGANVNVRRADGTTALSIAAQGHIANARVLLDYGADPNVRAHDEETPLLSAIWRADVEMVRLLLSRGANVNLTRQWQVDGKDYTPLFYARDDLKVCLSSPDAPDDRCADTRRIIQMLKAAGAKE